ncbi:tetratricopeptide repeat protein [Pelagicoccus sp. SDUM812005]|uniref:tetratricopeptide repeat protein n=1 Tax=Pelagicoccus sp. SDUM812005 TaxID=3041257 RepID=UPI00280E744A|nr:tetratricopeptide repeat protein [Pelagicoccus sp. SDUM812005]MDQ8180446.1 tetratricopeptide repeat protein [Pelagicoccus sp. SDUM812005]
MLADLSVSLGRMHTYFINMKNVVSKVSSFLAVVSVATLQSSFADVDGKITENNLETGAFTVAFDTGSKVEVGEQIVALNEVDGKKVEIGTGEVTAVADGSLTAIFDSKDVAVGMAALVKQFAPEHEADHLSAIPEDEFAVVDAVADTELDAPAAAKACREAIAEYPDESRFYAQLGRALEVDGKPASAILQYEKAIALRPDYPVALHNLAKLRFYGPEELRDFDVARKHFNKAAELGFAASLPVIGTMMRDAMGGDRDFAAAVNWFSVAAEQGNAFSQNALAECYENGWGIDQDISKALLWYRSSAELGYVPAYRNLGRVFQKGIGVTANDRKAFDWYSRAAEKEDIESQYRVGQAFLSGKGVVHSQEYGIEWLTKAADAGHAQAMRAIAAHYYSRGDSKNGELDLAAAWYKKAASKGDAVAQYNLGAMFEKGEGISRDKDSAIDWYRQAARQGHSESQKRLVKLKADW